MCADTPDYKNTLLLPETEFPMRAGLPKREPEWLARWEKIGIYDTLRKTAGERPPFVLHDGPPYANGHLHIGHALNKVLKDMVVRSQQMMGHDSRYVPGWDCHGLPIEWKIEEQYRAKGKDKDDVPVVELRQECRRFAEGWIDIQRDEFKRLGVTGNWDDPYLTMDFHAEATIAGRSAEAPGRTIGSIPAAIAAEIKGIPGSLRPGVPASLTSAIVIPSPIKASICSIRPCSFRAFRLISLCFGSSSSCKRRPVLRVSSQAIRSACRSTRSPRSVMSSRLPIGVGTTINCPGSPDLSGPFTLSPVLLISPKMCNNSRSLRFLLMRQVIGPETRKIRDPLNGNNPEQSADSPYYR